MAKIISLASGCVKTLCTRKKPSGLCSETAIKPRNMGINKNKIKPETRCKIEAIAVIGKRRVNKLRLTGRLATESALNE